mmetsp:Transcript_34403/g.81242  ORF Transcript_34403/g.81242 Transcript_34403/m.81242 type:complete len:416 (-) Transcript_34403:60-1307(-)
MVLVGTPRVEVACALREVVEEDVNHLPHVAWQAVQHAAEVRGHRVRGDAEAAGGDPQPQPAAAHTRRVGGGGRDREGGRLEQEGEGLGGDTKMLGGALSEVGVVVEGVVESREETQVVRVQPARVGHVGHVELAHLEHLVHAVVVSRDDEIALLLRIWEAVDQRRELQPHADVVRAALERHQQRRAAARVVLHLPPEHEDPEGKLRVGRGAPHLKVVVHREAPLRQRCRQLLGRRVLLGHTIGRQLGHLPHVWRAVRVQLLDELHEAGGLGLDPRLRLLAPPLRQPIRQVRRAHHLQQALRLARPPVRLPALLLPMHDLRAVLDGEPAGDLPPRDLAQFLRVGLLAVDEPHQAWHLGPGHLPEHVHHLTRLGLAILGHVHQKGWLAAGFGHVPSELQHRLVCQWNHVRGGEQQAS